MASGRRDRGSRRGGRARARALGRPGAGARRPRRGGRVPAARGGADRRPRAAGGAGARRRRRPACRPARSTLRAGCWRRRRSGRWTSCSAPASTCCAPRPRTPRAVGATLRRCCCALPRRSSRSIRSSRARPISTRGARRCSPGTCQHREPARGLARSSGGPAACRTSASVRSAAGRLRAGASPTGALAAAPVLEQAATGFAGSDVSVEEVLRWGWLATAAAVMVWDYETCLAVATRGVQLAREAGALAVLAVSVNVMRKRSRWAETSEGRHCWLPRPTASPRPRAPGSRPTAPSCSPAFRGGTAEASGLIDATIEECTAGGQGTAVQYARWAHSVLLNGLGHYQEAMTAAQDASDDTPELFVSVWAAIELIEAATRSDRPELARVAHRAHRGGHCRCAHRLGPGHTRALPCAAERRRDRRAPVPRGDRAAGPHTATPRARPRPPALRRVAAPGESPRRRPRPAPRRPRPAHVDRHGGVRRARPSASCRRRARRCASGPSRRAMS